MFSDCSSDFHESQIGQKTFDHNFGRSLFASYSDHYRSDFVLQGTSESNFQSKLHSDLSLSVQVDLVTPLANTKWIYKVKALTTLKT